MGFTLSQPSVAEPGTTFAYTTAGSHLLSAILQEASGRNTYDYAMEHLFTPLGIESAKWDADPQGISDGGNGLNLSTRDAAKLPVSISILERCSFANCTPMKSSMLIIWGTYF